jgi:hypothetical protein
MKPAKLTTIAIAATILLLSGTLCAVPAGQRMHRAVTRDAEITSVPAPVVDDTPINPDSAGKIKPRDIPKNEKPANKVPKRRMIRR